MDLADREAEGRPALVLAHSEWHLGVIGIVASKMVERYGKPAILLATRDGQPTASGSARSIPGFPMHEALQACSADLMSHGGHAMAAGLKLQVEKLESFRERFYDYAARHFPMGLPPVPQLMIDAELPLTALTKGLIRDLDRLEPYGADNPAPVFLTGNLTIDGEPRILKDTHMKFYVRQGGQQRVGAIAFYMADRLDELLSGGRQCSVVYRAKLNRWNGQESIEMEVVDFQPGPDAELA
jgi:single-stranded-DNA-specific exonuclease